MQTHIIIDGYNLLGASGSGSGTCDKPSESKREELVQELILYRQRAGHPITIVFDAWRRKGNVSSQEHRAGVTVIFSRQGEQADQVIQRMAGEYGKECAVVSSDHEVMNVARARGAFVMRSQEFLKKLHASLSRGSMSFGKKREIEEPAVYPKRPNKKGNPRKLPKALRHRLRNLKKF